MEADRVWLQLGAGHVETVLNMLHARVGKGRELYLQGPQQRVLVQAAQAAAVQRHEEMLILALTAETLTELDAVLAPHAGTYPLKTAPLEIRLLPTKITDARGHVLQVIE